MFLRYAVRSKKKPSEATSAILGDDHNEDSYQQEPQPDSDVTPDSKDTANELPLNVMALTQDTQPSAPPTQNPQEPNTDSSNSTPVSAYPAPLQQKPVVAANAFNNTNHYNYNPTNHYEGRVNHYESRQPGPYNSSSGQYQYSSGSQGEAHYRPSRPSQRRPMPPPKPRKSSRNDGWSPTEARIPRVSFGPQKENFNRAQPHRRSRSSHSQRRRQSGKIHLKNLLKTCKSAVLQK